MEKAKQAVSGFLNKDGKHNTTVHETVNPAVQNEHVTKTHHENVQTAIDREVHQDHHHTSVQPIHQKEVLPEQHTHNLGAVEHKKVNHGNDDHVRQRLEAEKAQFKSTREVGETQHTRGDAGIVTGEHVHHHVHETIQPVVQKETIQPSVVHTTIPVHEVHQNEAKHHNATQLPPVSMEDFKRQGGHLSGREERTDAFAGQPKAIGGTIGGKGASGTTSLTEGEHQRGTHGTHGTAGNTVGHQGSNPLGHGHNDGLGHNNNGYDGQGSKLGGTSSHDTTGTHKKPGLMDKLNPKVDADGDGKAGFMK